MHARKTERGLGGSYLRKECLQQLPSPVGPTLVSALPRGRVPSNTALRYCGRVSVAAGGKGTFAWSAWVASSTSLCGKTSTHAWLAKDVRFIALGGTHGGVPKQVGGYVSTPIQYTTPGSGCMYLHSPKMVCCISGYLPLPSPILAVAPGL